jgi:PBSX family phage terminase large subunit
MSTLSLFPKQKLSFHQSDARYNVWEGSVRSGKTIASILRWIKYVGNAPEGHLIMVGKTNRSLKNNVIAPMLEFLGDDAKYYPGKAELYLWGKVIICFGASDERSEQKIRGLTIAGAYGDEITLWPESFFKMLQSRLSVKDAKFFGTTNPDSPYHWLKAFLDNTEIDLKRFLFHLDDNTFLDSDFVEQLKREYVGLWRARFIEGKWVMADGAVYDFFDEKLHVIDSPPVAQHYLCGVDYGTHNPTVFLLFGVNPSTKPRIWLEREYYYDSEVAQRQKTDEQYGQDFVDFIGSTNPQKIFIDPSASSFRLQLKNMGVFGISNPDNSVLDGIRTQSRMLASGDYAICRGCENTIAEYGAYVWDKKSRDHGIDEPMKINDHTKDAERYVLHTLYGRRTLDYSRLTTL